MKQNEMIQCGCGCGELRPRFDKKGRERRYINGHIVKSESQREASRRNINAGRPRVAWNLGKTYVMTSKEVYANKGAWNQALRRLFPERCMVCGWDKASCDTHHIVARSKGGRYTLQNGIILCPNCHRLADVGILAAEELRRVRDEIKPAHA